jgi:hypothetical protein
MTLRAEASTRFDACATLRAGVEIAAAGGGPAKFSMLAYSGGLLRGVVRGVKLPLVIDLAGADFARRITATLGHTDPAAAEIDDEKIVGHVSEKTNDGRQVRFAGFVSGGSQAAQRVLASVASDDPLARFPWEVSIEAALDKTRLEKIAAGRSVTVNGQTFSGPLVVARKSLIHSVAFTTQGADEGNHVTIAATDASLLSGASEMDPEYRKWLVAHNWNPDDLPADKQEQLQASWRAELSGGGGGEAGGGQPPKPNSPARSLSVQQVAEEQAAENARQEGIAALFATFAKEYPTQLDVLRARADLAIEHGTSVNDYELELRRECDQKRPNLATFTTRGREQITGDVLDAAICAAGRLPNLEKHFNDQTLQAAHDRFKSRGIGLNQAFLLAAHANGYRDPHLGSDVTPEVMRAACGRDVDLRASGFSTLDIAGILSNTANKFLEEGWSGQDMTWSAISGRKSVKNFLTHTSYRLSGSMKYLKVGANGELKHASVSNDTYTDKADMYGIQFAAGRVDFMNDDLDAISKIPFEMGMGANDGFNEVYYTVALDNSDFFTSGNNNVSTGGGSALGLAGLTAAEVVFMNQTKPNGTPSGLQPQILLVPTSLRATADTIFKSPDLIDGSGTAAQGSKNIYAGRFRVESSPYLENSSFTGYGAGVWYLLADPARVPAFRVAFINGREMPTIETAEADFGSPGIRFRGIHDFGVSLHEFRGGVRSAGQ